MLTAALTLTLGTSVLAAEKSIDFCEINKGNKGGFVDSKPSGKLEVTTEDGKNVLKFTVDKSAEFANTMVNFEGSGFSRLGAAYDTYRYMSIEYKYVSKNPVYTGAFAAQLCNSNKVLANGATAITGTPLVASGKWETAYFDLTSYVDGRLAADKDVHTINHIHVRPFGSTPANRLDEEDVIYIGKVTFSEENLMPGGATTAPTVQEKVEVETPATTETPAELGGSTKGAEPKVMGEGATVSTAVKVLRGTVDNKATGTYEIVKTDGREVVKFTPNPQGSAAGNSVALDAHGLSSSLGKSILYEDISFISVEYFYAAKNPTHKGGLELQLANSNKVFQTGGSRLVSEPIVAGEWSVAYFHITDSIKATLKPDMSEHVLNHFQFIPFGNMSTSKLTSDDVLYVGNIIFHKENPNPKTEYTVSFTINEVGVKGEEIAPVTVKKGESFTLPECPWTFEGFKFDSWVSNIDNTTYKPGDTIVAEGDSNFVFGALWSESLDSSEATRVFLFANVYSGMVDGVRSATLEDVNEDTSAVLLTPNPEFLADDGKPRTMVIDSYGLENKLKIDLDQFKYVTLTYKYASDNPLNDVVKAPHITLTRNSGMFKSTGMALTPIRNTELVPNSWRTIVYKFPDFSELWSDPNGSHYLKQFHLHPFGSGLTNEKVTANDRFYVQAITFHVDEPAKAEIQVPYITGFEDGSFGLGQTMTRAQACTVVARLVAGGDANVTAGTTAFADVPASEWYSKYITYCEAKGLLGSYSGNFEPNKEITRAEFVELVYNIGLLTDAGKNGTFTDVAQDHPRAVVIAAAGKAGLVNGYDNGDGTFSFKPDNTISREEVVTVINNAYTRKTDKDYLVKAGFGVYFTDVPDSHWAFPAIIDASVLHYAYRDSGAEYDTWLYSGETGGRAFTEADYAAAQAKVAEVDALTEKRIAEIRATESTVNVTGKKYYFAADGNDANDGLSPEKPKMSLAAATALTLNPGDGVFFKRGDTFRGQLITKEGVTYSAYGEGEKPKLYGSPANFAGADNWEQTNVPNVWKLKTAITHDVGLVVFNDGEAWTEKRIKGRSDFLDGKLEDLDKDLTMWHDVVAPTDVSGYVYVRSDKGNPGELYSSIELNPRAVIISVKANDVTIDNLCLKYTGAHAVGSGGVKNLVVQNCEFGFIGGSWFRTDTLSRYGNAVEIYGAVDGYVVDNCYIYHVYDAGVTHQLSEDPGRECVMADVHYTNNVITYTSYPVEYFIGKANPGVTHAYLGLEISDNIIRYTGYGFGDQRPDKTAAAGIKSWNTYNAAEDFVMNNNIFDRSKYSLIQLGAGAAAWMPTMDGNIYIQYEDAKFGNIGSGEAFANPLLASYVKENSKDENAQVFVIKKGELPIG